MDWTFVAGVMVAVALTWAALLVVFWVFRPQDVPVREVLGVVPDILRLVRSLISDRAVPLDVRLILGGLLIWLISPIDLIPDFLPGIGVIDDVIVAILAFRYARRRMGIEGLRSRWAGTADGFALLARIIGSS